MLLDGKALCKGVFTKTLLLKWACCFVFCIRDMKRDISDVQRNTSHKAGRRVPMGSGFVVHSNFQKPVKTHYFRWKRGRSNVLERDG